MHKNIVNIHDLETYLDEIALESDILDDKDLCYQWLHRVGKRWVLTHFTKSIPIDALTGARDKNGRVEVRLKQKQRSVQSSEPTWFLPDEPWLASAIQKGAQVIDFEGREASNQKKYLLRAIIGIKDLTERLTEARLFRVTVKDAVTHSMTVFPDAKERQRLIEFDDGGGVDILLTEQALFVEGKKMHHCVGNYGNRIRSGRCVIMSLRNGHGRPVATFEVRNGGDVVQAKGQGNTAIGKRYAADIKPAVEEIGLNVAKDSDLIYAGSPAHIQDMTLFRILKRPRVEEVSDSLPDIIQDSMTWSAFPRNSEFTDQLNLVISDLSDQQFDHLSSYFEGEDRSYSFMRSRDVYDLGCMSAPVLEFCAAWQLWAFLRGRKEKRCRALRHAIEERLNNRIMQLDAEYPLTLISGNFSWQLWPFDYSEIRRRRHQRFQRYFKQARATRRRLRVKSLRQTLTKEEQSQMSDWGHLGNYLHRGIKTGFFLTGGDRELVAEGDAVAFFTS